MTSFFPDMRFSLKGAEHLAEQISYKNIKINELYFLQKNTKLWLFDQPKKYNKNLRPSYSKGTKFSSLDVDRYSSRIHVTPVCQSVVFYVIVY